MDFPLIDRPLEGGGERSLKESRGLCAVGIRAGNYLIFRDSVSEVAIGNSLSEE